MKTTTFIKKYLQGSLTKGTRNRALLYDDNMIYYAPVVKMTMRVPSTPVRDTSDPFSWSDMVVSNSDGLSLNAMAYEESHIVSSDPLVLKSFLLMQGKRVIFVSRINPKHKSQLAYMQQILKAISEDTYKIVYVQSLHEAKEMLLSFYRNFENFISSQQKDSAYMLESLVKDLAEHENATTLQTLKNTSLRVKYYEMLREEIQTYGL